MQLSSSFRETWSHQYSTDVNIAEGAFTYYVITFFPRFLNPPSLLSNQASSLSNPPSIVMSTSCEPPLPNKAY